MRAEDTGDQAALWLVGKGRWHRVSMAGASLGALPGGAPALHGIEDLMVDNGAVGAAQGHLHGLCPRRGAAGALVLHILRFDGVQCFAGTFTLKWDREGQDIVMVQKPGLCRTQRQPASPTCPPPSKAGLASPRKPRIVGQFVKVSLREVL